MIDKDQNQDELSFIFFFFLESLNFDLNTIYEHASGRLICILSRDQPLHQQVLITFEL